VTRKLAIVVLVLFVLLLAMPLGIGMAMGHCPACTLGPGNPFLVIAILIEAAVLLAALGFRPFRSREDQALGLLLASRLDRPPRFA
jgi:hypothetical protein